MSFFINNTEPSEAYFNGSEVSSIYYNGTLVWKVVKFEWGDETAIGDSAWWLALKEWVVSTSAAERQACIGKTKKVSLSSAVLGATAYTMRCIGADEDGEGTLTFESVYTCPSTLRFGWNPAKWIGSNARSWLSGSFYNNCSAKNAIKTISKGTCSTTGSSKYKRDATPTYNNETIFLLSEREIGLDSYAPLSVANSTTTAAECTYGYNAPYSYYANGGSRIKYRGNASGDATTSDEIYWLRSKYNKDDAYETAVYGTGSASYGKYNATYYLAPAFVIG